MTAAYRRAADWLPLIDAWEASGLSLPIFCQQHGIKERAMHNWVYSSKYGYSLNQARLKDRERNPEKYRTDPFGNPETVARFQARVAVKAKRLCEFMARLPEEERAAVEAMAAKMISDEKKDAPR